MMMKNNSANNNIISSKDYKHCLDDTIPAMFLYQQQDPGEAREERGNPLLNSDFK